MDDFLSKSLSIDVQNTYMYVCACARACVCACVCVCVKRLRVKILTSCPYVASHSISNNVVLSMPMMILHNESL